MRVMRSAGVLFLAACAVGGTAAAEVPTTSSALEETTVHRLLRGSPVFTGKNAGRVLGEIERVEKIRERGREAWIVQFRFRDGDATRSAVAPFVRTVPGAPPGVFSAEGWTIVTVMEDQTADKVLGGLGSARRGQNEQATLADLLRLGSAEAAYQKAFGAWATPECLGNPAACVPDYSGPPVFMVDPAAFQERSGYRWTFHAGEPVKGGIATWACVAVPVSPGTSGGRAFCLDDTGRICASPDGTAPPIEEGRCGGHCKTAKAIEVAPAPAPSPEGTPR